jgi:hypothetical protein
MNEETVDCILDGEETWRAFMYRKLRAHVGHSIVCTLYGEGENVAIECEDCYEVLIDFDHPDLLTDDQ